MTPTPGADIRSPARELSRAKPTSRFSIPFSWAISVARAVSSASATARSVGWPSTNSRTRASNSAELSGRSSARSRGGCRAGPSPCRCACSAPTCAWSAGRATPARATTCSGPDGTSPSHELRNAAGVLPIGLDRHGLEGIANVPRLQQLYLEPVLPHALVERQRPGLHPDPIRHEISSPNHATSASGSLATLASRRTFPVSSTMQTLTMSSESRSRVVLHPALRCWSRLFLLPSATPSVWRMTILTAYAAGPPVTPSMPSVRPSWGCHHRPMHREQVRERQRGPSLARRFSVSASSRVSASVALHRAPRRDARGRSSCSPVQLTRPGRR